MSTATEKSQKARRQFSSVFNCRPSNMMRCLCKEVRKPPTKRYLQHHFHLDETVSENVQVITTKDPENVEGAGSDMTVCLSFQDWKLKCNSLEDLKRKLKVENENLSQKVKDLNEQIKKMNPIMKVFLRTEIVLSPALVCHLKGSTSYLN